MTAKRNLITIRFIFIHFPLKSFDVWTRTAVSAETTGGISNTAAIPDQTFGGAMIFIAPTASAVILPHAFSVTSFRSAIHEPPTAATCGTAK